MLSRIHYRRMDQANHNLLMAVGGWGLLLPPGYRIILLYGHTTLSRNIVAVFNNEAREPYFLGFPRNTKQTFSLSQSPPAGVPSVLVPTGLSPHTNSNCDVTKKDKETEKNA